MSDMTLGDYIREKRLAAKSPVSLRELARRCEVTAGHICDIEHSRRKPSDDLLHGIADALGIGTRKLYQLRDKA